MKEGRTAPLGRSDEDLLRHFFHDLAGPLSAVALHLESAVRAAARGTDPSEALAVARQELEKAFEGLERGRDELLREPGAQRKEPRP